VAACVLPLLQVLPLLLLWLPLAVADGGYGSLPMAL